MVVIVVWIMGIIPVDARIKQIAYLVLFLIVVLALLDHFGIYSVR